MVSGNVLLDMLLSDSSSDDNSAKATSGTVEKLTIQSEEDMQHQQTADTWHRRDDSFPGCNGRSDLPCLFTVSGQPPLRRDIRHQGSEAGLEGLSRARLIQSFSGNGGDLVARWLRRRGSSARWGSAGHREGDGDYPRGRWVLKHGGGNDASDSCSSSSDPELQANNDDVVEVGEYDESLSYSSGYEGEDSSADEVDVNSSGSLTKDDDLGIKDGGQGDANVVNTLSNTVAKENCKLGFKCRLCPRTVCMTEETLKARLKSKGHARSEILLNKGRLRLIRNSVGEVEGEVNAGAERRARIAAAALVPANSKKEKRRREKIQTWIKPAYQQSIQQRKGLNSRIEASDKYVGF
ncbi:hypothetical protein RHSIM_Rhsim10G0074300 [Rhododendron simsii]|uniref:Uncharacterized protein n=1 Tax=Rhododendron simsii TaxID=118357 RepID=A0A834GF28_RHOSS|nr:hypothetical protein RHSIM_Rhsim10G0074300 [Rhododendron simsii]